MVERLIAYLRRPSRDARIILERIAIMDARIASLKQTFDAYAASVNAYIAAAEAHKDEVAKAVAEAVAKDDDDEDVDLKELQAAIQAAAAKVPPAPTAPAFEPSNQ